MTWLEIKLFFARASLYFYFGLRIYYIWSKVYQWIKERQYKAAFKISTYASYEALAAVTQKKLIWTKDDASKLWDVISSPEWVEYCIRIGYPYAGDCGAYAIYNAVALERSMAAGVFTGDDQLWATDFMSVMWFKADGSYGGHNVALLYKDFEGVDGFAYMDYDPPRSPNRQSIREVAQDIVNHYAPGGALVMYAVANEKLELRALGT